jgi:hypothetical protein
MNLNELQTMSSTKKYLLKITGYTTLGFILINCVLYIATDFFYSVKSNQLTADQYNIRIKQEYFIKNQKKFNLAFIGDSRTFCGMDPVIFDSLTQSKSINLAVFAFWMPSQYCYFTDMVPQMDTSVTLVWSIGTQNFEQLEKINDSYPIDTKNLFDLLSMGFKLNSVTENYIQHSPPLFFLSWRSKLYNGLNNRNNTQLAQIKITSNRTGKSERPLEKQVTYTDYSFSHLLKSTPVYKENGEVSSFENLRTGGNYIRFEVDSHYFRKKQKEIPPRYKSDKFNASPEYYQCFMGILQLMKKHHIKLIVNEIEEAPCMYSSKQVLQAHRDFMKQVQLDVEKAGFTFTRVNFDTLQDSHYFDYNHFNSKGVFIYNQLLSEQLKPLLN